MAEAIFGLSYSGAGLIAMLHRLGFHYRKPEAMGALPWMAGTGVSSFRSSRAKLAALDLARRLPKVRLVEANQIAKGLSVSD